MQEIVPENDTTIENQLVKFSTIQHRLLRDYLNTQKYLELISGLKQIHVYVYYVTCKSQVGL